MLRAILYVLAATCGFVSRFFPYSDNTDGKVVHKIEFILRDFNLSPEFENVTIEGVSPTGEILPRVNVTSEHACASGISNVITIPEALCVPNAKYCLVFKEMDRSTLTSQKFYFDSALKQFVEFKQQRN